MLRNVCRFFVITAMTLALISLIVLLVAPVATFDVTVLGVRINGSYSFFWLLFSLYALFLAGVYYAAGRSGLKLRRWLIITHCVVIILFFLFFGVASLFGSPSLRRFFVPYEMTLLGFLSIYIFLLASDILWFFAGWILLAANLLFSRRKKTNQNQHTN